MFLLERRILQGEKERQRGSENLHPLIIFQVVAMPRAGLIQDLPQISGVVLAFKNVTHSSLFFQAYKQGAGFKAEHLGFEPVPVWNASTKGGGLTYYLVASPTFGLSELTS